MSPIATKQLVRGQVAVVVATGGAAMAAKAATSVIPTVIALSGDPVKLGFVASLDRPGRMPTAKRARGCLRAALAEARVGAVSVTGGTFNLTGSKSRSA